MLKRYIKPNCKNIFLSVFIILFALGLGFLMFFRGVPIPRGLEILKIIGLPLQIISFLNLSPLFILPLLFVTIFWIYLFACLLLYLKTEITSIEWNKKKCIVLGIIFIFCFIAYGLYSLGWGDIFIVTADDSGATIEGVNAVANANNKFALDLYTEISKETNENILFSPWSISTAIVMAYEGARGDTAKEMRNVFYFPENDSLRRFSYARMLNTLNKARNKYKLHMANAIWLQEDYPFLEDYKDTISRYYLGEIQNLDFIRNPIDSSFKINSWVSKNTNNKIKEIVSPNMFTELTSAVLTNAIYFKGKWEYQFDRENTKFEDFTLESGQKVKVPMMRLTDGDLDFNYAESDGIQILEIPYQGDKISMLVLLPKKDISNLIFRRDENQTRLSNITELEAILTEEKLQEWRNKLRSQPVYIYMPKYKFETSYSLTDYLKKMGMELPFKTEEANFSGIDGTNNLYINNILHKAYIDVHEEGTEAAAATALIIVQEVSEPMHITFRADHPFIFLIQEKETGNILFIGRVKDPTK